jgi:hypothetical protein
MAGVVMVDCDPVQPGGEIQFDLAHEVARNLLSRRNLSGPTMKRN